MPAVGTVAPDAEAFRTETPQLLTWSFRLFVFSLPFEYSNASEEGQVFTASALSGYLFFYSCLIYYKITFRRVHLAVFLFFLYNVMRIIHLLFIPPEFVLEAASSVLTGLQLLILMLVSFNLMRIRKLAWDFLLTFGLACACLAFYQVLISKSNSYAASARSTAFNDNPNNIAMIFGLGLVALSSWIFRFGRQVPAIVLAVSTMGLLIFYEIVQTASRGGFLSLMMGVGIMVLQTKSLKHMSVRIGFVSVLFAALLWEASTSEVFVSRWTKTIDQGNMSMRDEIISVAWSLIQQRPLTGWGPVYLRSKIGHYFGKKFYDTHNLYFYFLMETGLLGAIPCFWALWLCVHAAWRARGGYLGAFPLTLVTMVLVNNLSDTWQFRKLHWLCLAFALASGFAEAKVKSIKAAIQPSG